MLIHFHQSSHTLPLFLTLTPKRCLLVIRPRQAVFLGCSSQVAAMSQGTKSTIQCYTFSHAQVCSVVWEGLDASQPLLFGLSEHSG